VTGQTHMSRKMKKISVLAPALLVSLGVLTVGSTKEASAQEIQVTGPLKGAPAVRRLRLYREGRFEIAPSFTATILDEYQRTVLVGARLNYGITDWLAIGVWGGFGAIHSATGLTEQIDQNTRREGLQQMNVPGKAGQEGAGLFQKQVAQISYIAMPQLTVVPFRGKFALFQSVFADVDFYLMAGFGIVGTKERKDCADFVSCAADGQNGDPKTESKTKYAPTWGLGFNFYLSKLISLGVEWRMIPFSWNRSGFDSRGLDASGAESSSGKFPDQKIDDKDSTYKFNQMMSIYLGFSFPTMPKTTD
jgi:outer membrane beta-barrel protein